MTDHYSHRWASLPQMSALPLLTLFSLILAPRDQAYRQTEQPQSVSPLEVRVTKPLLWEEGYLKVGIDRTNHSPAPLYLPDMGTYVSLAVSEAGTETAKGEEIRWVNLHGVTDIVSWQAKPVAPQITIHDDYYFGSSVAVVNLKKETRREIPLRGKLRVDAFYFLSEEDWQKNKSWHVGVETSGEHFNPWRPPDALRPQSTTTYVEIPCHEVGCNAVCNKPPMVFPGEHRLVPDFYSIDDKAKALGKALNDELARKPPACSEDVQPTQ